jgi:glycine/D-amino acid oxidase-like deaminating enzyme
MSDNFNFSYWEHEYYSLPDVCIIGAGITGLSCAIELARQNPRLKIVVIEKSHTGTMATTRNAGFLCYGSPTEILRDLNSSNEYQVIELLKRKHKGQNALLSLLRKRKQTYRRVFGYELFDSKVKFEETVDSLAQLNIIFKEATGIDTYYKEVQPNLMQAHGLSGFTGIIQLFQEGQVHSQNLDQALELKARNLGIRILRGVTIRAIQEANGYVTLFNEIMEIKAKTLVLATNAFLNELVPEISVIPNRGQILVTTELKSIRLNGNYHFNEGYVYFRNVGKRILLGGARNVDFVGEQGSELKNNDAIQKWLENFLFEHLVLDKEAKIDYQWSGIMGFTPSGLPYCERHSEHVFIAGGMNGMGVAIGAAMGFDVAQLVLEKLDPKYNRKRKL